jgi:type IV secretion system protein VirB3
VTVDPLFVGVTRPAMAFGVTYAALLVNALITVEAFLLTRNLLWLGLCIPLHALAWLLCATEPRFFDLLMLWGRTRGPATMGTLGFWRASSYSPLALDAADRRGRRTGGSIVFVRDRELR